ncbi:MAG: Trk system potassium transporter TrkA [Lachnospiraceae bacterium]|nr:Trk system potassium transporter TrkA [Lachnospiraceae bacterium]
MRIIVVGCGNVGSDLVDNLCKEGHDITVIDENEEEVNDLVNNLDVMGIVGNGASMSILEEAGVRQAQLLIAVTGSDELNLLCCLIAKKKGNCHTIARVINPVYNKESIYLRSELGLSMIINPQQEAAREASRLLKFPSAMQIDSFTKGRVELIKFKIEDGSWLCNKSLKEVGRNSTANVLIAVVERGEKVFIPGGDFILREGDAITVAGLTSKNIAFFKQMGFPTSKVKSAMIVGGGSTAFYLASDLISMGVKVKIIERDMQRCEELSEALPSASIIHGDGTNTSLLVEEGISNEGAFLTMTGIDEENIMLAMYAKSIGEHKLITKVHRVAYDEIIGKMDIGSVIYPKYLVSEKIVRYVRAMQNSVGSNIETLYKMCDGKVESLEFVIGEDFPLIDVPLKDAKIKPNVLICSINHKGTITMAGGNSVIKPGDTVVVITTETGFSDFKDILA